MRHDLVNTTRQHRRAQFQYFKGLHIGLISEAPRKSLPALAKVVGEGDNQGLRHFVAHGNWDVEALRERSFVFMYR